METDTAKHKTTVGEDQTHHQGVIQFRIICDPTFLFWLLFIWLIYILPAIVNSIKSHPPHSLCGLLRSRGGEAADWDVGDRLPRMENVLSHNVYEASCSRERSVDLWEAATSGFDSPCVLLEADTSCPSYFLSRHRCTPDLHKHTVGVLRHLACGCQLQQCFSTFVACDLLKLRQRLLLTSSCNMCFFPQHFLTWIWCPGPRLDNHGASGHATIQAKTKPHARLHKIRSNLMITSGKIGSL